MTPRLFFFASTICLSAAGFLAASCIDNDDCTRTATCPIEGGGGTGAGSVGGGTTTGGGSSTGGGDGSKGLGESCASPSECESALCVDDVCCDAACEGTCSTCNGTEPGTCEPVATGGDPGDECGAGVCDGNGACLHGDVNWAIELGDAGENTLGALAADGAGAVYVLADLQGAADDAVDVRKVSASGSVAYTAAIPSSGSIFAQAAATNPAAGLIYGGYFTGDTDFGEGPTSGTTNDPFVGLLDASGQPDWGTVFPSDSGFLGGLVYAVTTAPDGDILVGGNVNGTTSFGNTDLTGGLFLARLSSTGTVESATGFTQSGSSRTNTVAVNDGGDVALSGHFTGTLSLGGPNLVASAGNGDLFLGVLDPSGNHAWSKAFATSSGGGLGFSRSQVAIDALGKVVVASTFGGTVNLGGDDLTAGAGENNVVVGCFDADGSHLWSRAITSSKSITELSVAIDSVGDVVVVGRASGAVDLGNGTRTPSSTWVAFVAKYTADGSLRWGQLLDASLSGNVRMVLDSDDNIVVAGEFSGMAQFGSQSFNAASDQVFVVSLTP